MSISEQHMHSALALAQSVLFQVTPNPAVGCVIVADGKVVGEGATQPAGDAHAEVMALRAAGDAARAATVYVSLEPCTVHGRTPPCVEALIAAGVERVVYACDDPNPQVNGQASALLRAAGIDVVSGVLADEARALNVGFFSRMQRGRPFVTLKIASSLDGRTAMRSGQSQWITGAQARADVQHLRAHSCAIMTGVGTVLADDPALTVRDARFGDTPRQPLRVILDSGLRTPPRAKLLREPGKTMIFGVRSPNDATDLRQAGASYQRMPEQPFGISLSAVNVDAVMQRLGELGMNYVLVEAGSKLAGSLLARDLVDRFVIYLAPKLLGSETFGMFDTPALHRLTDAKQLRIVEQTMVGDDIKIVAVPGEAQA